MRGKAFTGIAPVGSPTDADTTPSYPANAWTTGTYPSVNYDGTPLQPTANPDGSTPYTIVPAGVGGAATAEGMHIGSVLGPLSATALTQLAADPINCSQYTFAERTSTSAMIAGAQLEYDIEKHTIRAALLIDSQRIMPMPNYLS